MTRTSRASHPRALVRDRSVSRTGRDPSIPKNGAGQHNWGTVTNDGPFLSESEEEELDELHTEEQKVAKPDVDVAGVAEELGGSVQDKDTEQFKVATAV